MDHPQTVSDRAGTSSSERKVAARAWGFLLRTALHLPLMIVLFALPVTLKALRSYFTFDDLMNLNYYVSRPWLALASNLIVLTSFRRPLGALLYLPLFGVAGLSPEPYYLVGVVLHSVNIVLAFVLVLRLSDSRFTAFISASLLALHPEVHNVLFNFGAVFELLCLLFMLVSTICYRRFIAAGEPREWRWYIGSLLAFLAALNAKETAVVLPAILFALHFFSIRGFRAGDFRLRSPALFIAPFAGVVVPYTLVKILGQEAYWRENAQYVYHFDRTIPSNLAHYLNLLSNQEVAFSAVGAAGVLGVAALTGLLLKNRPALFGLGWALLSLLPVLPLPRYWGLFLYIPLFGFALSAASLIYDLGCRIARFCLPGSVLGWRTRRLVVLVLAALYLFRLEGAMSPDIDRARRLFYHDRNPGWRSFAGQLYEIFPRLPDGALLIFANPPFDGESQERWCLHFLVRLKYGPRVRIARSPDDDDRLPVLINQAAEVHRLIWNGSVLREQTGSD